MSADPRRSLPSVAALLESAAMQPLLERSPRSEVVDAIRSAIAASRADPAGAPHDAGEWAEAAGLELRRRESSSLRRVLNATGIALHTNLGRAPLARAAIDAITTAADGYVTLEYDLDSGSRGSRYDHCVPLLRELTGAEDALVVNNCASALILALQTLAARRQAVISRGELVEIGGSFRIPDIMRRSGARLVEVGTTNRTHVDDYRAAAGPRTGAIVKVHRSNFVMSGFVAEVAPGELAELALELELPLIYDLGSGLILDLAEYGLSGEPTAREAVRSKATAVLMSGDKLLGGPQAGIILGRADAIAAMRRNPLARALRVDKLTLAALHATLALHRDPPRALREIPVLAMLTAPPSAVRARAERLEGTLAQAGIECSVVPTVAAVGGGAFPTAGIPSFAVRIRGEARAREEALRRGALPVIARIEREALLLDLRSVPEALDDELAAAVRDALA